MQDTVFALSSGAPPAAIAVVRISGPGAGAALITLAGKLPQPRYATLAILRDRTGGVLDRALILWIPGPASETGEDMAELHLHGGRAVIDAVLGALSSLPELRPARAGEFVRRAFANGKLDLAQLEGLADLVAAETEAQRRNAVAVSGGMLSRRVATWQTRLLSVSAAVEALLDFSDEDDVTAEFDYAPLNELADEIDRLLAVPPAERLRDGVRVVLAGPPNAGKSSLLNALASREAAITSSLPGTTRDLIEVPVSIEGLPILLVDTAGLREAAEEIEAIGVDRARGALADADIVLWLGDADALPSGAIGIFSRSDVRTDPPPAGWWVVSAVTGSGLAELRGRLLGRARALLPREGEVAVNRRQRDMLGTALSSLRAATVANDLLIVAEELRNARSAFDAVTGRAGTEAMLDALFSRFCIGK